MDNGEVHGIMEKNPLPMMRQGGRTWHEQGGKANPEDVKRMKNRQHGQNPFIILKHMKKEKEKKNGKVF